MNALHEDPAERTGYLRHSYRNGRPTRFGRIHNRIYKNAWSQVATSGRKHLPVSQDSPESAYEAIAADYPVFRIDPA